MYDILVDRIETQHVSSAREVVCRIDHAFKPFNPDDREAMVAEHGGGKLSCGNGLSGHAANSRLLYGRERCRRSINCIATDDDVGAVCRRGCR